MVKYSDGVAMLKDCIDWRPPRRHDGVIILSPPEGAIPPASEGELRKESTPASQPPLPQRPPASSGDRHARGYSSGVVTSADFGPWVPPKPQRGLIVEGRWVPLPDASDEPAPPESKATSVTASPKRRARKR
jgi:hypothetical protein